MSQSKVLGGILLAVFSFGLQPVLGQEQHYPNRPVTILLPVAAGGGADVLVRTIGERLTQQWGQPVIVDNRPGAGGNIAATVASKAEPDGYLLFLGNSATHGANKSLYTKLSYDPVESFTGVAQLVSSPVWLLVPKESPFRTIDDIVVYARKNPDKLSYGSVGFGTPQHLAAEAFKKAAKIDMVHVPYKGGAEMIRALLADQIHLTFDPSSLGFVRSGQLRAIAVLATERKAAMPDVPTSVEQGWPDLVLAGFMGLMAPKGISQPTVNKINAAVGAILKEPDVRQKIDALGLEPASGTARDFDALIRDAVERYGALVRASGAKIN